MDSTSGPAVGDLLRQHRFRAGLSQSGLAERAGVSVRAVRYIEQGRVARPHATSVQRLARALDLADADRAALLRAADPPGNGVGGPPRLRVAVLGPLAVHRGGAVVELESTLLRTLLGLLAIQPGRVVQAEEIVDVLWDDRPPRTCRQLVHTYIGQLRRLLEPDRPARAPTALLPRTRAGYRLDVAAGQSDLHEFDDLVQRAGAARAGGDPAAAFDLYGLAWSLWRGPLLADGADRLRHHPVAAAISHRRLAAALDRADLARGLGRCAEVLETLRSLAAAEPLHEGLAARLMLVCADGGQRAAALDLFDAVRRRLDDELGVEPGPELRAAHVQVLRSGIPPVDRTPSPPAPAGGAPRSPVPGQPTPAQLPASVAGFAGRDRYLRHLDLAGPGAVTVIAGMGGIGKTALAVHWAHLARARFPDGQLYINLGGHGAGTPTPPGTVLTGFLRAFGLRADQVPAEPAEAAATYRSLLADRRVLVLLDNAADADQVRPLLPGGPHARVLITSRDRLTGLVAREGAEPVPLDALTPEEANALLVAALGADRTGAEPVAAGDLAAACAYLPLALRIAAANLVERPRSTIGGYVTRLRTGDRLAALAVAGDPGTAVRAAFDLSYAAATAAERRLFRLLGLAPGPDITASTAADLGGLAPAEAESVLDRLAARHLVAEETTGRYSLHDLLRLYAAELAAATDDADIRQDALTALADHYLAGARSAADLLYPHLLHLPRADAAVARRAVLPESSTGAALDWLDAERANLVATVVHLAPCRPHTAWLLADVLQGYFRLRTNAADWQTVAAAATAAAHAAGDLRAAAAGELSLGSLTDLHGRYDTAEVHYTAAHDLATRAGWTECRAVAVNNLARVHWIAGRLPETIDHLSRALALHNRTDRRAGLAVTLTNLGTAHLELARVQGGTGPGPGQVRPEQTRQNQTHTVRAREYLRRALALHRDIGDKRNESGALRVLAIAEREADRPDIALDLATTAVALARETTDPRLEAQALSALGTVLIGAGQVGAAQRAAALRHHGLALLLARDVGEPALEADVILDQARTHLRLGEHDDARSLAEDALRIAREAGARLVERRAFDVLGALLTQVRRFCPESRH